jgi:hypothetical protein
MRLTDQCPENMSWLPVFSSSGSYCRLHNADCIHVDCLHHIIEYVDTGFLVVEVATCIFIVFLQWLADNEILLSVLSMVTNPIRRRLNIPNTLPKDKGKWRGHALMSFYMTVGLQSLSSVSQPSQSTLFQHWHFVYVFVSHRYQHVGHIWPPDL